MKRFKTPLPSQAGFTLIEIMLVLAISGLLIFAIFDAFSFGQRIHRDNQRKEDLQLVAKNLDELKDSTDYSRFYPYNTDVQTCDGGLSVFQCFFDPTKAPLPGHPSYAISGGTDPLSGGHYTYLGASGSPTEPVLPSPTATTPATFFYRLGWACGADPATVPFNAGIYRLETKLEDGDVYCLDNH